MADRLISRLWTMRALYVLLCLGVMYLHFLPLDTVPRRWAPPDWIMMFTFAWALRRPDYVPTLAVAGVMLLADFLFHRPPGLMAALLVLGNEYIKTRLSGLSDASFAGEWASVAIVVIAITVANRVILTILAVDTPPFGMTYIQAALTILAYPLAAFVTYAVIRVRKPAPGDVDALGART